MNAEAVEIALAEFALVHLAVRPRVSAQTAELAIDEVALIALTVGKNHLATAERLAVAPLTAGHLGSVRAKLDALTVLSKIRIELADVMAAVGQQQRATRIGGASCLWS